MTQFIARLMPPEYFSVPEYDAVWSEDEQIKGLSEEETISFIETTNQFPLYSEIDYHCTVIAGVEESGSGKVIGYCLRTSQSLFHSSYFYLLVMAQKGLVNINIVDAERTDTKHIVKREENGLCSTTAMAM